MSVNAASDARKKHNRLFSAHLLQAVVNFHECLVCRSGSIGEEIQWFLGCCFRKLCAQECSSFSAQLQASDESCTNKHRQHSHDLRMTMYFKNTGTLQISQRMNSSSEKKQTASKHRRAGSETTSKKATSKQESIEDNHLVKEDAPGHL